MPDVKAVRGGRAEGQFHAGQSGSGLAVAFGARRARPARWCRQSHYTPGSTRGLHACRRVLSGGAPVHLFGCTQYTKPPTQWSACGDVDHLVTARRREDLHDRLVHESGSRGPGHIAAAGHRPEQPGAVTFTVARRCPRGPGKEQLR
ncbi:hypothetical protein GCM10018962_15440 [Dactylosporangium matsuzakiense]|uniref:Uncharacterized protein n=1 Tax=Dactylosporangium matsuzakiense TaxID=53360 RepID=A0A9W6KQF5_9ACTN|nr:hypothetical protein GCM10017581_071240 [Dactylosporangium matsuzakiense]